MSDRFEKKTQNGMAFKYTKSASTFPEKFGLKNSMEIVWKKTEDRGGANYIIKDMYTNEYICMLQQ